ncbi:hypothetical protein [Chromohalobacter japonicus]|uniref:hypothetical protein n=1 Tax=Chromohalobacter japonicus TaxID=223900 RepID=UPI000ACFDE6F|nr:hypothetical protein [Chromohalobacter japonicus]
MAVGIALAALLLLFVLGTPVAFALFLSTFLYFLFGADQPTMLLIQRLAGGWSPSRCWRSRSSSWRGCS